MSKVKIQGNASGTGVLTVTAPNTSTDRTITLPDSTDTLAVNSDVTNKLPLAGGNLTGAVSLTGGDLVIDQTNNGYSGLRIHDDSGGDYNSYIDLGRNQGGTRLSIRKGGRVQGTSPWQNATPDVIVSFANEGIAFHGDTAAANTLDDYEEGNWSSVLRLGGDGGADNVNSTSYAKYTKIGNLVYINVSINMLNTISGSGHLVITGLPFVPVNSAQLSCRFNDNMNSSDVVAQATGSSAIHFYKQSTSTGGALNNFTNSDINSTASGKHVNVSGTYRTS